jgi:hypothetical protein
LALIRQYVQQERYDARIAESHQVCQNVEFGSHRQCCSRSECLNELCDLIHVQAQPMTVFALSGDRLVPASCCDLVGFLEAVGEAAAQDQQASILAGIEWVWHARTGLPTKAVRLVMVASAVAIE